MAAGKVLLVGVIALFVGAQLNADSLYATASRQPFGWQRTAARAVVTPFRAISHTLHLNGPRTRIEESIGHDPVNEPTVRRGISRQPTVDITPEAPPPVILRRGTPEDPLRVWVGGDSMSRELSVALQEDLGGRPGVAVTADPRVSTGLTRPDYFDWPAHLADDVLPTRPEVMVVMFGANDAQTMELPGGLFDVQDPQWQAEYRNRVGATMDLLAGEGRLVIWVGQPHMRDPEFDQRIAVLDGIYQEEAAGRPWVRFLDSRDVLSPADKEGYAAFLPGDDGQDSEARQSDGVHMTRFGAARLGTAAARVLDDEVARSLADQGTGPAPGSTAPPAAAAPPTGGP